MHIPDPYESLIRYYGYYSNAARGKRKKLGIETEIEDGLDVEVKFIGDFPSKKKCRKSWLQLVGAVDGALLYYFMNCVFLIFASRYNFGNELT